jgi:hypothetical protein
VLAHDVILLRREQLSPFGLGVSDGVLLVHTLNSLSPSSPAKAGVPRFVTAI